MKDHYIGDAPYQGQLLEISAGVILNQLGVRFASEDEQRKAACRAYQQGELGELAITILQEVGLLELEPCLSS
jgi:hypothetical protein